MFPADILGPQLWGGESDDSTGEGEDIRHSPCAEGDLRSLCRGPLSLEPQAGLLSRPRIPRASGVPAIHRPMLWLLHKSDGYGCDGGSAERGALAEPNAPHPGYVLMPRIDAPPASVPEESADKSLFALASGDIGEDAELLHHAEFVG